MIATGLFHPGRQHSWHTAAALKAAGMLAWYATSIYYDREKFPYSLIERLPERLGAKLQAVVRRRQTPALAASDVRHLPAWEWLELALARASLSGAANRANEKGNLAFQKAVIDLVRREPVGRLWGYDTSAALAFEALRDRGLVCVLDQSIAHMGGLRRQLAQAREAFAEFIADSDIPSQEAVARSTAEIRSASHIVVGCRYAADLAQSYGAPRDRIHICPYGYQEENFPAAYEPAPGLGSLPVRFVFVGSVSLRKGFHLMAKAFAEIPPHLATLTLIGPSAISREVLQRHLGNIEYHPSVPNAELRRLLARAHCFLFPSLHEGGGIVLYEAAACGLGIIQSANCGDGVRSGPLGPNGLVLPEITVEALRAAIDRVLANPAILRDWSAASWAMREERSWSAYRRRIVELLPKLV